MAAFCRCLSCGFGKTSPKGSTNSSQCVEAQKCECLCCYAGQQCAQQQACTNINMCFLALQVPTARLPPLVPSRWTSAAAKVDLVCNSAATDWQKIQQHLSSQMCCLLKLSVCLSVQRCMLQRDPSSLCAVNCLQVVMPPARTASSAPSGRTRLVAALTRE